MPGFEVAAVRDHEPGVVKAGDRLAEQRAVVGVVTVQHDHELGVVVGEELADSAGVRHVHPEADAEHVLVPADAGIDIRDCQREVMQTRGWNQDPAGTAGSGRCAVIVVPLFGADRTSSRPSRAASLSAILRWPDPIGVQLTS